MNAHPTIRRHTISITGRPLLPVAFTSDNAKRDETIHGDGWLVTVSQAARLFDAWKKALAGTDDDDPVIRGWTYSESGVFVTALCMDGEIGLSSGSPRPAPTATTSTRPSPCRSTSTLAWRGRGSHERPPRLPARDVHRLRLGLRHRPEEGAVRQRARSRPPRLLRRSRR